MTRTGVRSASNRPSLRRLFLGAAGLALLAPAAALADDDRDGWPDDNLPVYLDRSVHPTAEEPCTPGFLWQGSGNPSTTFQRKRNLDTGVELALKAIYRQGPDIRSTYVDGDGLVHIEVPAGPQPSVPSRAAWNFTYSYDVALDPSNPDLDRYNGELWIDLDPSKKTRYLKLKLSKGGVIDPISCPGADRNGYRWKSGTTVIIPDDEGTQKITQNSQNYAFYRALIDTDRQTPGIQPYAFGPAEFDVVLMLSEEGEHDDDDGQGKSTTLHVVYNVVTAPTQTP
ncbi:MAG TPA: hypothetical protein VI582_03615 [Aestuariivirga sp.]|nr:hypothetical protein [Aestuariivirga sp.]